MADLTEQVDRCLPLKSYHKRIFHECLSLDDEDLETVEEFIDFLLLRKEKRRKLKASEKD